MSVARTQPTRDESENLPSAHSVAARSRDAATLCTCELHTESGPTGSIVVVRVAGEIDILTIPTVHDALAEAVDQRPADLVIDLSAVGFCCVRGFTLLATAARAARISGIGCAVSGMTSHLDRVASMLWPEHGCIRYRSVATALSGIRMDQTSRPA